MDELAKILSTDHAAAVPQIRGVLNALRGGNCTADVAIVCIADLVGYDQVYDPLPMGVQTTTWCPGLPPKAVK